MKKQITRLMSGLALVAALSSTAASAFALNLPQTSTDTTPVTLTCYGNVVLRQAANHMAEAPAHQGFVEVILSDGDKRILLPQGFNPNGGDNGWYQLKNFKASDADIIGNASVSFIDKPFVRVDRVSGRIDVSGLGGTFTGECRPTQPASQNS